MPHDPARVADTKARMIKAAADLRSRTHQMTAVPPNAGDAAFHAQQATEKSMRAFLTWHDVPFRKTHDLANLGATCSDLDASLLSVLQPSAELTQYAWRYRYPGEPEEPPPDEVVAALTTATRVYDAILSRLPAEAHP